MAEGGVVIVFTGLGILVAAVWAGLLIYLLVMWLAGVVGRRLRSRRISREVNAAARSLTDEEVASWLS
jgi:hypothetical protein